LCYSSALPRAASSVAARSNYRPDIDGLRAFAVLSVVLYHAFPKELRGGYVGVDIFFVISGFLISSILFDEMTEDRYSFTTSMGGASGASSRRLLFAWPPCWLTVSSPDAIRAGATGQACVLRRRLPLQHSTVE